MQPSGYVCAAGGIVLVARCWAQSVVAAELVFMPVPCVGYLRVDVAAGILVVLGALSIAAPRLLAVLSVLLLLCGIDGLLPKMYLADGSAPTEDFSSWYKEIAGSDSTEALIRQAGSAVPTHVPNAVDDKTINALANAAWASRHLWTKQSLSGPIGYFSYGSSLSYDASSRERVPFWSVAYGFRALLGFESSRALLQEASLVRRFADVRGAQALDAPLWEPVRLAFERILGGPVVFGGSAVGAPWLGPPTVQVYLPNLALGAVVSPHTDTFYVDFLGESIRLANGSRQPCDGRTATSLLVPLVTPRGAGLLWWGSSGAGAGGRVMQHEILYTKGSVYAFPTSLVHSVRPWPYSEWRVGTFRMTAQSFAVRCGVTWYVVH